MSNETVAKGMWGRFEHNLDEKFRFIVPKRFLSYIGEEVVLCPGPDKSVRVYPMHVWDELTDQLAAKSISEELDHNSIMLHRMFGNCEYGSVDSSGRVTIPKHLREHGDLENSGPNIFVGMGSRIEIWNRTNWKDQSTKNCSHETVSAAILGRLALAVGDFAQYSSVTTLANGK